MRVRVRVHARVGLVSEDLLGGGVVVAAALLADHEASAPCLVLVRVRARIRLGLRADRYTRVHTRVAPVVSASSSRGSWSSDACPWGGGVGDSGR